MFRSSERIRQQREITGRSLWNSSPTFREKTGLQVWHPVVKRIHSQFLLVGLACGLTFIGLSLFSLVGQPSAWAAEARSAHLSSEARRHATSLSFSTRASLVPHDTIPWSFPCSDTFQNGGADPHIPFLEKDWLSGLSTDDSGQILSTSNAGHFSYTYPADTYAQPQIRILSRYMQVLAFILLMPSAILFGYQIMLGISTFRYAGAIEGFSRILLGGLAVAVSPLLVQMLINLEGTVAAVGIAFGLHHFQGEYPFFGVATPYYLLGRFALSPSVQGQGFDLGENPSSYLGLIQPITRWGCNINDFIGIFSQQFITNTLGTMIPLFAGLGHLSGASKTPPNLIHASAAMLLTVLSMLIFIQVYSRIVFLNYYIFTAPLACSCWALPARVGQKTMALWFRGFISVLFAQVAQLFVITVLPLIMPPFPPIPPGTDNAGVMQALLLEFPPVLTVYLTFMVPSIMGASITQAVGTARGMAREAFGIFLY